MTIFSQLRSQFFSRSATSAVSALRISRSFLPPGFSSSYTTNRTIAGSMIKDPVIKDPVIKAPITEDDASLSTKLCAFIVDFCPLVLNPLLSNLEALDWKGGGADDTLLRVEGGLRLEEDVFPFTYSIFTRFKDFPNRNQIRFIWAERRSLVELESIPLVELCRRQDIAISSFSFNLEYFQSNILTRLSGFGPVVAETLLTEISLTNFALTMTAEGLNSPDQPPLTRDFLFEKISLLVNNCYQFSPFSDYTTLQGELS